MTPAEAAWRLLRVLQARFERSRTGGEVPQPDLAAGGNAWLHHWLEPVIGQHAAEAVLSHGTEITLVAIAVVVAATGMIAAWRMLKLDALVPARSAPAE